MKKRITYVSSLMIAFSLLLGISTNTYAATETRSETPLGQSYEQVMSYAAQKGISLGMTYEDFTKEYQEQNYKSVVNYTNAYY